ncbi:MAG: hypothetical protein MKZ93_06925 [Prochlorococcus sp. ALOHA_A2.0_51]|nr:hypothetical protein [Prochlorococcus sp. ALOHA_A2.0_51]
MMSSEEKDLGITIENVDQLPPKGSHGKGRWQRLLEKLDDGTIFSIEDDEDQSVHSKYRSIRTAAISMGRQVSVRSLDDGRMMIELVSKDG